MRMGRILLRVIPVIVFGLLLPLATSAQDASGQSDPSKTGSAPTEKKAGGYIVSQSVEFGGRITDVSAAQLSDNRFACGSDNCDYRGMYDTFVNLQSGPRLLEQSLSLRAPANTGVLFDDLFLTSFGWGGDPNNVARLRVRKGRAYRLNASFRRDQNFFDYNLLANPLNPPATAVSLGNVVPVSPHAFFSTRRRMSDVDLTIAPLSVVSLRLGYSRNRFEGPVFSSFHMPRGTDIDLFQDQNTTSDLYRAGLDFRFIPKTTISYDQFFTHNKNETVWPRNVPMIGAASTVTIGGVVTPTDLGLSWNLPASQPCAAPFTAGGTANPACNQGLFMVRSDRYRTNIPTEQLSIQSHPSKRFDLNARVNYSHSGMSGVYSQFWSGRTTTGRQQRIDTNPHNRRNEASADFGATFHVTEKLRISDNFRWFNWRIDSFGPVLTTTWSPTGASTTVTATPVQLPSTLVLFGARWKEERKENQVELEYDFTRAFGARVGYRYTRRFLFISGESANVDPEQVSLAPGDFEGDFTTTRQPIHTGLFGFWIRPNQKFRASFDMELSASSNRVGGGDLGATETSLGIGNLTRITPDHEQQYRFRANYNPQRWMVLAASLNWHDATNRIPADNFSFQNRTFGLSATLIPNDRFNFDLGYNYQNYQQTNLICPIDISNPTSGTSPNPLPGPFVANAPFIPYTLISTGRSGTGSCPFAGTELYFETVGRYENANHFFNTLIRGRIVPRVTLGLGYSVVASDGVAVKLNPLLVPGSLVSVFHRPLADLEIELARNFFAKAGWNYYGYNEKGDSGPTIPRDFHANVTTLSLKYAF